jgi:hypothetical protein
MTTATTTTNRFDFIIECTVYDVACRGVCQFHSKRNASWIMALIVFAPYDTYPTVWVNGEWVQQVANHVSHTTPVISQYMFGGNLFSVDLECPTYLHQFSVLPYLVTPVSLEI